MELKPPHSLEALTTQNRRPAVFLGGSIEQGSCEDWQARVSPVLQEMGWLVLNPRRDEWDSSWVQSVDNPEFADQVYWELNALCLCERILMYFDPATKAPVSLLETGLFGNTKKSKLLVVCPDGYWRKGNIDLTCRFFGIPQAASLEDALKQLDFANIP